MQCNFRHLLLATALIAGGVGGPAQAMTRAEVRADLAEWRAKGLLEKGEVGATTDVLRARERFYQEQRSMLIAKAEREQRLQAERDAAAAAMLAPDVVSYTEAGVDGPMIVIAHFDKDGIERYETVDLASID